MLNNNRIDFRLGNKIYMGILSTREWATVIWAFIFFVYAMVHRQIREAFWKVVKIFFGKKLRILWGIILLYVLGITLIFYHLPFWDNVYIKDIIVWFLFSGLIYCMNAVSQEADEEFIRKVLKDNLKLTAILEFIISTFTFNIWVELAIIPITTMIVMMNVIAERKEEYEKVHKLLDIVLAVAGFWILYETKVVPYLLIAVYRKDVEKCIQLIKEVLMESQKPWKMVESPLYYRYVDTVQGKSFSGVGNNFVRALATEIENKEEYEFLKGNKELEAIFSQYLK